MILESVRVSGCVLVFRVSLLNGSERGLPLLLTCLYRGSFGAFAFCLVLDSAPSLEYL